MEGYAKLRQSTVLLDMGRFEDYGGWVLDTQFIPTMGAPYLLAHGLGRPVRDATTTAQFPAAGTWHTWAYTFNWVAPWKADPCLAPGRFRLLVDGRAVGGELGREGERWGWHRAGQCDLGAGAHKVALQDLTGFEGRCGMLFFTQEESFVPPSALVELRAFLYALTGNETPHDNGWFDMVVVGGGMAGTCCALSAARQGLKTALLQNRPVLGGNNSSEVRVWLGAETNFDPFPGVGNIVHELEQQKKGHYGDVNQGELYEDGEKLGLVEQQENLHLFTWHSLVGVEQDGDAITAALAFDSKTARLHRFGGALFADCTGDGTLGAAAGAQFEMTANAHQGTTNFWYVTDTGTPQSFPRCPWAMDLSSATFPGRGQTPDVYGNRRETSLGCWFWESGMEHDPIEKAEYARDTNFRAMYGAWDALKNVDKDYKNYKLGFAAYIGGKRESRRLLGDVVLDQGHILYGQPMEDGCVATTWDMDVHYPDRRFYPAFVEGDAFLTKDYRVKHTRLYFIPYRCLYSRNLDNLFMAGRNISVTHDALGSARIMRTGGMMGEVIGYAAAICKENGTTPRGVYQNHLPLLLGRLQAIPKGEVRYAEMAEGAEEY